MLASAKGTAMARLTVKELLDTRGQRRLTQVFVRTPREAAACEAAGIEMLVAAESQEGRISDLAGIRAAAPGAFITFGLPLGGLADDAEILRESYRLLDFGADAIYCPFGFRAVEAMANRFIPTVGHVGLVPYLSSWFGGFRAVGKTASTALEVWERTRRYEEAGAMAVEMEVVPKEVAAAICERTKMLVIGMGSGQACHVQYLFATDVLGDNEGHIPRHAKQYRDFKSEYARLHRESIEAFRELRSDVQSGTYPAPNNDLTIAPDEFERFLEALG
ncbi:MAG: hypothetical protein RL219_382 [Actinomycetota bacterium]|jgi:3-methyl-2-oxobutanoate hydroxymethyltransferase